MRGRLSDQESPPPLNSLSPLTVLRSYAMSLAHDAGPETPPSRRKISQGVARERAKVGGLSRDRADDDPELAAARQALKYETFKDHARKVVAEAPQLTPAQVDSICALLRGA